MQVGESLGLSWPSMWQLLGTDHFEVLGLEAGLYLGHAVPHRTLGELVSERALVDPKGLIGLVSQASEIADLPGSARHVMVIHHDDPINKYDHAALVRAPWWMGPPTVPPASRGRPRSGRSSRSSSP